VHRGWRSLTASDGVREPASPLGQLECAVLRSSPSRPAPGRTLSHTEACAGSASWTGPERVGPASCGWSEQDVQGPVVASARQRQSWRARGGLCQPSRPDSPARTARGTAAAEASSRRRRRSAASVQTSRRGTCRGPPWGRPRRRTARPGRPAEGSADGPQGWFVAVLRARPQSPHCRRSRAVPGASPGPDLHRGTTTPALPRGVRDARHRRLCGG
jgi:hypothetical protein